MEALILLIKPLNSWGVSYKKYIAIKRILIGKKDEGAFCDVL